MDRIPKIFVINLPHRKDRLSSIIVELKNMNLLDKMEVVKGVIIHAHGTGTAGIAEAHARCIELAKERGYERIMILQDDCKFLVDAETFDKEIGTFLDTAGDWSGLWFGSFGAEMEGFPEYENKNHFKALWFNQDSGILINSTFYDELIEGYRFCKDKYIETGDTVYNIDGWLSRKNKVHMSRVKLCSQADTFSDRLFTHTCGGCWKPL